jgi:hypothetical protein
VSRPRSPSADTPVPALDSKMRRGLQRFVRLLVRCGCPPELIEEEVRGTCRSTEVRALYHETRQQWVDMGHALTLWYSDPDYLDAQGNPRALPLRGDGLSIESLAQRVDPKLEVEAVLEYLERGGALQREGDCYVPCNRVLIFTGTPRNARPLTGLFGLIKTLEHNLSLPPGARPWLERFSRNPRFPVSAARAFENKARRVLGRLLVQFDAQMHTREAARDKDEPTVSLGFGLYSFEEDPPEPSPSNHDR